MINDPLYIDIHTHQKANDSTIAVVVGKHVLGLHPWDLSHDLTLDQLRQRFDLLQNKGMLAVGECGLDRKRAGIHLIEDQIQVFSWHIELAQKLHKPLIVHCVHAQSDLLAVLKKYKFSGTILLHDLSGNAQSLEQFKNYNAYFSFGARLFKEDKKREEFLKLVPLHKLFLETDDQSQYSIEEIYQKASELLNISQTDFCNQIEKNLKNFFGYTDDVSTADIIKDFTMSRIV